MNPPAPHNPLPQYASPAHRPDAPGDGVQRAVLLAWRLFVRDTLAKYRHSVLGLVWAVVTPLFLVGLLLSLNRSGVVHVAGTGDLPYPVFVIAGVTIWGILSTGLSAAAECLSAAGSTMLRVNFPRSALVLAGVGRGLFEFLVRLPVVIGVIVWCGVTVSPSGIVMALVSLIPLVVLTLALGLVVAVSAVLVRDLVHVMPILLTVAMLLSPVLYSFPPDSLLGRLNVFNPIHHFLETARGLFLGHFQVSRGYWIASLLSCLLLPPSWRLFKVAQARILERL